MHYEASVSARERELEEFRNRAQAYVKSVEEEIQKDRTTIDSLKQQLVEREAGALAAPTFGFTQHMPSGNAPVEAQKTQTAIIRAAAREILEQEGRPMSRAEIKTKIEERGIVIESTDVAELIRAALKRGRGFRHISGVGYELTREA
ncbi:hypothetical protein [Ensifer adhaerens]|uniref:hypothetical protein n=1 Tax=Ensifer adhaerens TaxID=106592 RepID=UPI0008072C91|nr:hypothetical protein [Ensifer adhaerens]